MTASHFKIALFAIALSPFILNAELREDLYEDEDYVTYTDDRDDENEDGLYYDDDDMDDDLADASYSQDAYSRKQNADAGCHSPFHRMHFGVRHTEARGVGYHDGYTTLEGFGIYDRNPYFMPFLDLRGHVFNNGKLAGNVGIGERTVLSSINHIIGAYLYYDVRQENHSFTVNQLSPGIELLGKRMEYRMNGYFPVGGNHSHKYGYQFNKFDGHNILLRQKQKFAMKGGDAEVGAHITQSTKYDLYAGAGPYYFSAGRSNGWGGKVRLLGRYKEYVSLEASYSYDRVFHSIVQGTVGFNYAFGKKLSRKGKNCPQQNDLMLSRAAFAPYRFEIPVVKRITKNVRAINPATGSPWQVWFVDNTSSSAGTYQSPYPTLAQAESASSANDMIYVFPGNGTTTGMDMGITLKDGQKLFGSSVAHKINTTRGKMVIPTFSRNAPMITNTGNVVSLANSNEVSGMNIFLTTNSTGISGTNINEALVDRNTISGSSIHSAVIINGSGKIVLTNNHCASQFLTGTFALTVFPVDGPAPNVLINNNTISGYLGGIQYRPNVLVPNANVLISQNNISGYGNFGIFHVFGTADSVIRITENTIFDSVSTTGTDFGAISLDYITAGNTGTSYIQNNTITSSNTNPSINGILVKASSSTAHKSLISNNSVQMGTGAGSIGINMKIGSAALTSICSSITNNKVEVPAPATTKGISITAPFGTINIDALSMDQAPSLEITGNVNFVAPGTCGL